MRFVCDGPLTARLFQYLEMQMNPQAHGPCRPHRANLVTPRDEISGFGKTAVQMFVDCQCGFPGGIRAMVDDNPVT